MVYAKQIESHGIVGNVEVPSEAYLAKNGELFYTKSGVHIPKNNLTIEDMLSRHRIATRMHSAEGETVRHLATRAVEGLNIMPEVLIVAHNEWPAPLPAIAGIAQYLCGYGDAPFCDMITNDNLPGTVIAEALVNSGKYKRVVYASSTEVSKMRTEELFNVDKFENAAKLFQKGQKPIDVKNIDPKSIDYVLVDHKDFFESRSDWVKEDLKLIGVQTLDVIACCPGYILAVEIADALIKTRTFETITCVGAETMEKMADPRHLDHSLYGSGAGATTYQASSEPGIICFHIKGFGNLWGYLKWGPGVPLADNTPTGPYMIMEGPHLYRFVLRTLPKLLNELIEKSNNTPDSNLNPIDLESSILLLHQMNGKLIEHIICDILGIDITVKQLSEMFIPERVQEVIDQQVPLSVHKYGNSSSASIPVLEDHARRGLIRSRFSEKSFEDKLKIGSGTIVFKEAAGAGFIIGGYKERL
ncbi:hypothetical protein KY338_01915 [Candidatus Woesearchaeota archaeon]|nr:hypothetical protein [Candidatus Woesearchaeota archaeon]MBW3005967.1 hypothetical protein [Candidatus Woesearchaeota archaeon]